MRLKELLWADSVVVQCHNDPDADAIASGWGVYKYFAAHGKRVELVYGGGEAVRKSNLVLMQERLHIPIRHVAELTEEPDLLVTVDCQPGERNVQDLGGKALAAIDHHTVRRQGLAALRHSDIRDNYGACATVVWDLLRQEPDFDLYGDRELITALYYGLFMDTCRLQEIYHRADRAARDALEGRCLEEPVREFKTHNLSLQELTLVGEALQRAEFDGKHRFAVAEAAPCDPNILGIIADQLNEVDEVDVCVVFCMLDRGAKLSIRSCVPEVRADELARHLSGGGGHQQKAGGMLVLDLLRDGVVEPAELSGCVRRVLRARVADYLDNRDVIRAGDGEVPDLSGDGLYRKMPVQIGYVRAAEVYQPGSRVKIRTMEGDQIKEVSDDLYLMVGIDFEVYDNTRAYFESHNDWSEELWELPEEKLRLVEDAVGGVDVETRSLAGHIRRCVPKGNLIRARRLERCAMVFTRRGHCFRGEPGDYLAAGVEDLSDLRIINGDIFRRTYGPAEG